MSKKSASLKNIEGVWDAIQDYIEDNADNHNADTRRSGIKAVGDVSSLKDAAYAALDSHLFVTFSGALQWGAFIAAIRQEKLSSNDKSFSMGEFTKRILEKFTDDEVVVEMMKHIHGEEEDDEEEEEEK